MYGHISRIVKPIVLGPILITFQVKKHFWGQLGHKQGMPCFQNEHDL